LSEPVICLNFLKEETKTPFGLNAGLRKDEAMDAALPDMISVTLRDVNDTGIRRVFIGDARGAGSFISSRQFERFYFPWLKKEVETFAASDIISLLHFDQDWTLNRAASFQRAS